MREGVGPTELALTVDRWAWTQRPSCSSRPTASSQSGGNARQKRTSDGNDAM